MTKPSDKNSREKHKNLMKSLELANQEIIQSLQNIQRLNDIQESKRHTEQTIVETLCKLVEILNKKLNAYRDECARLEKRIMDIGSIPNDSPGWRELRKEEASQTVIDLKERLAAMDAMKK